MFALLEIEQTIPNFPMTSMIFSMKMPFAGDFPMKFPWFSHEKLHVLMISRPARLAAAEQPAPSGGVGLSTH